MTDMHIKFGRQLPPNATEYFKNFKLDHMTTTPYPDGHRRFILNRDHVMWEWPKLGKSPSYLEYGEGYTWNGASAPALRQRAIMASLPHDNEYDDIKELRGNGGIKEHMEIFRKEADIQFLLNMIYYDKQSPALALFFYRSVRLFGYKYTDPKLNLQ